MIHYNAYGADSIIRARSIVCGPTANSPDKYVRSGVSSEQIHTQIILRRVLSLVSGPLLVSQNDWIS